MGTTKSMFLITSLSHRHNSCSYYSHCLSMTACLRVPDRTRNPLSRRSSQTSLRLPSHIDDANFGSMLRPRSACQGGLCSITSPRPMTSAFHLGLPHARHPPPTGVNETEPIALDDGQHGRGLAIGLHIPWVLHPPLHEGWIGQVRQARGPISEVAPHGRSRYSYTQGRSLVSDLRTSFRSTHDSYRQYSLLLVWEVLTTI
jgi:hypothetical protein